MIYAGQATELMQARADRRARLHQVKVDAETDLTTAIHRQHLAAKTMADRVALVGDLHVAPEDYVDAYRRRTAERDAAEEAAQAAHDAWVDA